jgi:hypothetical protein
MGEQLATFRRKALLLSGWSKINYSEKRCSNLLFKVIVTVCVKCGYVTAEIFSDITTFVFKIYHHQKFGRRFRGECGKKFMFPTNRATGFIVMCPGKLLCDQTLC